MKQVRKFKTKFLLCTIVLGVFLISRKFLSTHHRPVLQYYSENFPARNDNVCHIPRIDIWPVGYPTIDSPVHCHSSASEESISGLNTIWVEKGILRINASIATKYTCHILPIHRQSDFKSTYGDVVRDVTDGLHVKWNFFKVVCLPKSDVDRNDHGVQAEDFRRHKGYYVCGSFPPKTIPHQIQSTSNAYNVMLLGLDSTSRVAALRYLPKTMEFIRSLSNAFVMEMNHVVGDGTTASLMALLTGYFEEELPESRQSHVPIPGNISVLDSYPWLWDAFTQVGGYATHFIEDMPRFGTFHYRLVGFGSGRTPTHSFGRSCFVAAMQDQSRSGQLDGCIGLRYSYAVLLESLREFFYAYSSQPRLSLTFISELVHENPAYAGMFDDSLKQMLHQIQDDDEQTQAGDQPRPFANTIVVFFGDHGSRIGGARLSVQGKLEERLPLLTIILPKRLLEEWPEAANMLRINTNRLLTMFDVHATLEHVLRRQYGERAASHIGRTRGQSLFTEIPKNRSCAQAAISAQWCTCLQWFDIVPNGGGTPNWPHIVNVAAAASVKTVNAKIQSMNRRRTQNGTLCSVLGLSRITSAEKALLPDEMVRFVQSKDIDGRVPEYARSASHNMQIIRLDLILHPLDVKIEAMVRMSAGSDVDKVVQVRRLDRYEPNAWCQPTSEWPAMRPFCVCVKSA